jgi:hypothetical protein
MTQRELEAILAAAFDLCAAAGQPLSQQQREFFWQVLENCPTESSNGANGNGYHSLNPLTELDAAERQALLDFIAHCERHDQDWKHCLLEDWIRGRDSGAVQFIRDRFGPQWLTQIQPMHLSAYLEPTGVKLGDPLEISNSLWEWVSDNYPELREWYPCQVVRIFQSGDQERIYDTCTVRLENGLEYDIPGMYDWNRIHWRLPQGQTYPTETDA